ncbi:MAG: S-layer homology domain-containing protein [Clostridiales bacterium]|nr:S-layer homology domain-containing protein [Clostridiales bacterium]
MLKVVKKSLSALLAVVMIISTWSVVWAADGDTSNYEVEIVDELEYDGVTYSNLANHGKYVKPAGGSGTIYLDQSPESLDDGRLKLKNKLDPDETEPGFDDTTNPMQLYRGTDTALRNLSIARDELYANYSANYFTVIHVSTKNKTGNPISFGSSDPMVLNVRHVCCYEMTELSSDYDKYFLVYVTKESLPDSEFLISQGEGTSVLRITMHKAVRLTKCYCKETEFIEQYSTSTMAGYDRVTMNDATVFAKQVSMPIDYIQGETLHFVFDRTETSEGKTDDTIEYELYDGNTRILPPNFIVSKDEDGLGAMVQIPENIAQVGKVFKLRMVNTPVGDVDTKTGNNLARPYWDININVVKSNPITSLKFSKDSYNLTMVNNKTMELKPELTIAPTDVTDKVYFSSSDASVATVDKNTGIVTAVAIGEAEITAYSRHNPNVKTTCTICVRPDLQAILIDGPDNIVQGQTLSVEYSLTPSIADGIDPTDIVWTSSNTDYLTVTAPDAQGTVKITATDKAISGSDNYVSVTLTAKSSNSAVTATKNILVWADTPSGDMIFTPELVGETHTNLKKSLVTLGADEYNIYDEQSVKIGTQLLNSQGQTSTDKLNWRVTIDGTSITNSPLSAASSYFSYTYNKNAEDKNLTLNFLRSKYAKITLTGYAVVDDTNDNISNPHFVKSIVFHVNRKTTSITTAVIEGPKLDSVGTGDEITVQYTLNSNVQTNVDRAYIISDDPDVLFVESYTNVGRIGTIKLKALKEGSANLKMYATYDVALTTGDTTYYTCLNSVNIPVKYNINDATVESSFSDKVYKNNPYTVDQIKNELSLSYEGSALTYNTNYSISEIKNNRDVGECTVIVSGKGDYAGTMELTFNITPYILSDDDSMTVDSNNVYTGLQVTPGVSLRAPSIGATLTKNTDYTVSYDNNIEAGEDTATVTVEGVGNYAGLVEKTFTIKPRSITDGAFVQINNLYPDSNGIVIYDGQAYTPDIDAKNLKTGNALVDGVDYTLTYTGNTAAGSAKVTINGIGNYYNTTSKSFTISARDIKDNDIVVADVPALTYSGGAHLTPIPTITYNDMTLVKDVDYTISYTNNQKAGTATIVINGSKNYSNGNPNEARKVNFTIDPFELTAANTSVTVNPIEYTGLPLTPNFDVKSITFNTGLSKNNDGTGDVKYSYSNNINVGSTGVITISGTNNYTGTFTTNFTITPTHVNNMDIENPPEAFYDGTEHRPDIVAKNKNTGARLKAGIDYYLEYENNTDVGNAKVIINGMGNYTGKTERTFKIAACNIADTKISAIPDQTFQFGEGIRPAVTLVYDGRTLTQDVDYRIEYRDNYNVGTATMTFVGLGDFGGTTTRTFKINPYVLTASNTKITVDEVNYDGKAKTPGVKVELTENGRGLARNDEGNADFKVTYSNNVNSGTDSASVVITGTKNFTGSVTKKFSIKGIDINRAGNENVEPVAYTGSAVTPKVKLTFDGKTLTEGTDYKLSYKDNVNPGEATIIVTGLGNFNGTKEIKFRIKSAAVRFNADSMDVVAGDTKRMPFDADEKVTWTSSDKKICTVNVNGEVTGKMAGKVTITGKTASGISASISVQVLYKDVTNTGDFWYKPTYYLTNIDVVKGYDNQTTFKPANECTRGQMVTFLWRLQGCPNPKTTVSKFKDVKKSDYFFKAVLWGNENHIVEGYKDGTFGPKIVCQRKHAVTFMWRLAGKPAPKTTKNKFKDVKKSDYFYKAVLWASEKKIVEGYAGGKFKPDGNCLRRQMVTFLYKYDKYVNGKG